MESNQKKEVKYIKLSKKAAIIVISIYAIIAVLIFVDRLDEKYIGIKKESEFSVVIVDFFIHSSALITLNDSIHISLYAYYTIDEDISFRDFIQVGDSIRKSAGSDTVYLYRDNKEYYFFPVEVWSKLPREPQNKERQ